MVPLAGIDIPFKILFLLYFSSYELDLYHNRYHVQPARGNVGLQLGVKSEIGIVDPHCVPKRRLPLPGTIARESVHGKG